MRPKALRQLELLGLRADPAPAAGMFIWVDAGCDTNVLAARAMQEDILLAPGSLFSPRQLPSTRMRLNVAALQDPATSRFLEGALGSVRAPGLPGVGIAFCYQLDIAWMISSRLAAAAVQEGAAP